MKFESSWDEKKKKMSKTCTSERFKVDKNLLYKENSKFYKLCKTAIGE